MKNLTIMKKVLGLTLAVVLLVGGTNAVWADKTEGVENKAAVETKVMHGSEALELLRNHSELKGDNEFWYSPLAYKYDHQPIIMEGQVSSKTILEDGTRCLVLDFYKSEHVSGNWRRGELFQVKLLLAKENAAAYDAVNPGEYIKASGEGNIDYHWGGIQIDKRDQASMRGLANFQGNGRGTHEYSFEVREAKVLSLRNGK